MKNFSLKHTVGILSVITMLIVFGACEKEKPTRVLVTVYNEGMPVYDAQVIAFFKPTDPGSAATVYNETQYTDTSGKAMFDLSHLTKPGQAGFVVLNLEASKGVLEGQATVDVKEGKLNQRNILMQVSQ